MIRPLLGYCTNVHAGVTLSEIKTKLDLHAVAVRQHMGCKQSLGVGLWIPAPAAAELTNAAEEIAEFAEWLSDRHLEPYTINGFPYDNFHMPVVKHRVYSPTWWEKSRCDYTSQLIQILDGLLAPGKIGSISTLPISWGAPVPTDVQLKTAASELVAIATELRTLEDSSGRHIVLAIEPEPGCYLQDTKGLIEFFDRFLQVPWLRRYLTVCHDVCHAAVMNESQAEALRRFRHAGLMIGKVQVSAAIEVDWTDLRQKTIDKAIVIQQLQGFAEDRYLHQTGCVTTDGAFALIDDLPLLLNIGPTPDADKWRIHFHMPIHLRRFGNLETTQQDIIECFDVLAGSDAPEWTGHFEVETYAWSVLPIELRPMSLATGIATELIWLADHLADCKHVSL